ncbi:MAG: putative transposase [Planctomycetota bacterium]
MKLAERGSLVGAGDGMWMREVRKLTSGGHPTSQARFAARTLHPEADEKKAVRWEKQKSVLREEIEQLEHQVDSLREQMKSTPKHLEWDQFPADAKFERLAPSRKRLTDTVKLVAYRAETAMSGLLRESLRREDDSRSLLRDLFRSDADITPHCDTKVLEGRIHTLANPRSNHAIQHLLDHLNAAESNFPGTEFRLTYTLTEPENGLT